MTAVALFAGPLLSVALSQIGSPAAALPTPTPSITDLGRLQPESESPPDVSFIRRDCGQSVELLDGTMFFLFCDTVYTTNSYQRMLPNSAAFASRDAEGNVRLADHWDSGMFNTTNLNSNETFLRLGAAATFPCEGGSRKAWPRSAVNVPSNGKDVIYIWYMRLCDLGGLNYVKYGTGVAKYTPEPNIDYIPASETQPVTVPVPIEVDQVTEAGDGILNDLLYGDNSVPFDDGFQQGATLNSDGKAYLYRCSTIVAPAKTCSIARVTPENVADAGAYEYFANGTWNTTNARSWPILTESTAAPADRLPMHLLTTHFDPSIQQFVMVYTACIMSCGEYEDAVVLRTSSSPEGTWSAPVVAAIPEPATACELNCYAALAHPELSEPGGIALTFAETASAGLELRRGAYELRNFSDRPEVGLDELAAPVQNPVHITGWAFDPLAAPGPATVTLTDETNSSAPIGLGSGQTDRALSGPSRLPSGNWGYDLVPAQPLATGTRTICATVRNEPTTVKRCTTVDVAGTSDIELDVDTASDAASSDSTPGDGVCRTANGTCSLRAATEEANAWPAHTTINLMHPGPYPLSSPVVLGNARGTQVNGNQRVIQASGTTRLVTVTGGSTTPVLLNSLVLDGGNATSTSGAGGAISNSGALALSGVTVSNSRTFGVGQPATGFGGGVHNAGALTVTGSTFSENAAGWGGAIYSAPTAASLSISSSTFTANVGGQGGAVYSATPNTTITASDVNTTNAAAGGALYTKSASLTLEGSTIRGTTAGGAIVNNGSTLTVRNSTISGNTRANDAGGITTFLANGTGTTTIEWSTLANNTSTDAGPANIAIKYGATVNLKNSIVATPTGSTEPNCSIPYGNTLNGIETNAATDNTCGAAIGPKTINLGPLADNGDTNPNVVLHTHALLGTAATNQAIDTAASCPATSVDQRGITRPVNGWCDLGAYERQL